MNSVNVPNRHFRGISTPAAKSIIAACPPTEPLRPQGGDKGQTELTENPIYNDSRY